MSWPLIGVLVGLILFALAIWVVLLAVVLTDWRQL